MRRPRLIGRIRHAKQRRSPLAEDHQPDADASRGLVLLRLRGPHVRGSAQQDRHPGARLPARLLHGRAGLADRVRGPCCSCSRSSRTGSIASSASPKTIEREPTMATEAQTAGTVRLHQESRPHVRHVHGRIPRLHHPARRSRAGRRAEQDPRLPVRVLHARRLRRHRHRVADGAGLRILRRRPARAGVLQRHGDRRRLDVGGVLRRHGRHAVPARL